MPKLPAAQYIHHNVGTSGRKRAARGFQVRIKGLGTAWFQYSPKHGQVGLTRNQAWARAILARNRLLRHALASPLTPTYRKARYREVLGS